MNNKVHKKEFGSNESLIDKFLKKVKKTETCWLWTGFIKKSGYGLYNKKRVHRIAYELFKGHIPKGMFVCHSCDVRNCVNPDHLWLGTNKDNLNDMKIKGRGPRGEKQGRSKLTEKQVIEIRKKYIPRKRTTYDLAKEYGINQSMVYTIISRKTWKHL